MSNNEYKVIKEVVDKLLDVSCNIKTKRKKKEDSLKDMFVQTINMLDDVINRGVILNSDFQLDLSAYEEQFYLIIESLLYMYFGKDSFELISFYLWDRLDEEGNVEPIYDEKGNMHYIDNANKLWDIIVRINPKIIS